MLIRNAYSGTFPTEPFHGFTKLQNKLKMNQEYLTDVTTSIMFRGQDYIKINGRQYLAEEFDMAVDDKTAKLFTSTDGKLVLVRITNTDKLADINLVTPVIGAPEEPQSLYEFTPYTEYSLAYYKSKVLKAYLDKGANNPISEKVVGISHRQQRPALDYDGPVQEHNGLNIVKSQAILIPEPDNPYDSKAVKVIGKLKDGSAHHIGYVPKDTVLQSRITKPTIVTLEISDFISIGYPTDSYKITLE